VQVTKAKIELDDVAKESNLPEVAGLTLSVVIPAFNEQGAVRSTVQDVRSHLEPLGIPFEIIVVDDGSQDNTRQEAIASGATVDFNDVNSGYGAALKRGVRQAKFEYVAILDADGTYPAKYLPAMLEMCRDQDMVVGDRGAAMRNVPLIRRNMSVNIALSGRHTFR